MKQRIKKYILIAFFAHCTINAQTLTVDQYGSYLANLSGVPENITHIKDINNSLQPFVGSWHATENGKTIYLYITFGTRSSIAYQEFDHLKMNYKIVDASGIVMIDTRIAPWVEYTGLGWYLRPNGNYALHYKKLMDICDIGYSWTMRVDQVLNTSTHSLTEVLGLILIPKGEIMFPSECPNGYEHSLFPTTDDFIRFRRI